MSLLSKTGITITLVCLVTGNAWADRRHWHPHSSIHWGVQIGAPWGFPPVYSYPYPVYSPPVFVAPAPQPVYIERQPVAPQLEPGYWYYCNESKAYYPYVQQCQEGWQKIAPQPPQR